MPIQCTYGKQFSVEHALSCPHGGFLCCMLCKLLYIKKIHIILINNHEIPRYSHMSIIVARSRAHVSARMMDGRASAIELEAGLD